MIRKPTALPVPLFSPLLSTAFEAGWHPFGKP